MARRHYYILAEAGNMNSTIKKFGYPATLIHEYDHWVILLRPAQITLGSLILAAKSDAENFADLPVAAYAEMKKVSSDISAALTAAIAHQKLNYLMLMMVDPHVHFHVFPRYQGERSEGGLTFSDQSWPGPPDLESAHKLSDMEISKLVKWISGHWPAQE